MIKADVVKRIHEIGIIPAIRVASAEDAHFAAETVAGAGIPIVEITMTVPEAVKLISHLVHHHPNMIVGAGTVLSTDVANLCSDAGASFLTSPGLNQKMVEFAAQQGIAVLPGAMTPTEVIAAWEGGADFVKVYPCEALGGEKYIKSLGTAMPQIPLIAAGGVKQQTASGFILAGASAIGVGTELIPADAIANREKERIQELAQRFLTSVSDARQRLAPLKQTAKATKTDFLKLDKPEGEKSNKRSK
jgi:2-dehydro-3-deoxyphosphogluconate aldolase / (4S)-4-hydroxy-2-oxoglutarate aldolase